MGQRHQYIIVYPKMKLSSVDGKSNPKNKPMRAEVIHHQWLYGHTAIRTLGRVLTFIKNSIAESGNDYMFSTAAISAVMSVDPESGYFHHVDAWKDADWNGMKNNSVSPDKLDPNMFDNNDGITLIVFERNSKKPKYAFITPSHLEGSHWTERNGRGPWSAKQYLEFYYSKKQQTEFSKDEAAAIARAFKSIDENATLLSDKEVFKLLKGLFPKKQTTARATKRLKLVTNSMGKE